MLLALEIGLLIFGIIAVATGKLTLTKNHVVRGTPARLLGVVGILTLPSVLLVCFAIGFSAGLDNRGIESLKTT